MTFRKFVNEQVARLTAFEEFNRLPDRGKQEFSDLLFDLAKEPTPKRDRAMSDWLSDSQAARNVKAVTDEGMEFQKFPSLVDLRAIWKRIIAAPAQALRENCERCQGTGWIAVQGPYGTSAAYPCTHAPETDSDRRMGVRIPPAVANHYREEAINAEPRRELHVGSGGHVNQSELTRVNLATIGKLVHGFETGERRESNS